MSETRGRPREPNASAKQLQIAFAWVTVHFKSASLKSDFIVVFLAGPIRHLLCARSLAVAINIKRTCRKVYRFPSYNDRRLFLWKSGKMRSAIASCAFVMLRYCLMLVLLFGVIISTDSSRHCSGRLCWVVLFGIG